MKPTEAAALLTIAAAYDNRKPDADQAKAWAMALDGMRFEDCRTVIVEHYKRSRDWLMPVDVIQGVKRLRSDRLLEFGPVPEPQGVDPDDTAAYQRALTDTMRQIADGTYLAPEVSEVDRALSRDVVRELGHIGQTVDEGLKPAREAHAQAVRAKQEAEAAKKRAEDERRAEHAAARAALASKASNDDEGAA